MYSAFFCTKCFKPFAKVGAVITKGKDKGKRIEPVICPTCESDKDVITNVEFLERQIELEEAEEKKKLEE